MPKASAFDSRAKQVWELHQQGLTAKQIAEKIGRWHYRTIENDIARLNNTMVGNGPDWFTEAQLTAFESIDDLRNLRDEAWKMFNNAEKPPTTMVKIQLMKLLSDINGRLADKLLPSQAIVQQVGDTKMEISWKGDEKDLPLCTRCGIKHKEGECALVGDCNTILSP